MDGEHIYPRCSAMEPRNNVVFPLQRLPKELRDYIWNLAFTPRIIKYRYIGPFAQHPREPAPQTLNPAILHACHESSAVALEAYKPLEGLLIQQLLRCQLYWNPEIDVLKIPNSFAQNCPADAKMVRRIVLPVAHCLMILMRHIPQLESIEEIYFLEEGYIPTTPEGMSRRLWTCMSMLDRYDVGPLLEQRQSPIKIMAVRCEEDVICGRFARSTGKTPFCTSSVFVLYSQV